LNVFNRLKMAMVDISARIQWLIIVREIPAHRHRNGCFRNTVLTAVAFNMEPDFKTVKIVSVDPQLTGDYHLTNSSITVIDRGTNAITRENEVFQAPQTDFDGRPRPQSAGYDIGAYEHVELP